MTKPKEYLVMCAAIFVSTLAVPGCNKSGGTILGQAPNDQVGSIASAAQSVTSTRVTIRGTMIEKCPVAGCWFIVKDETGTIKVDTKLQGFVVIEVPLQAKVLVSGRVVSDGLTRKIEATGLRY